MRFSDYSFLPFYVGKRQTEKKRHQKRKNAKNAQKMRFGGGWEKVFFFQRLAFLG